MTVEQTLQVMTDKYPTIFYNRQTCLNHLFCVIGNGYDWKKGELVDPIKEKYEKKYSRMDIKEAIFDKENEKFRIEENNNLCDII